ncbi:MAG: sulfur oxidation c-type cytochrome SoxX [Gammaproteobacteria bacterium]|nr:sulfur oxidation c-type cytochrome SoxX [Gammaproteobacteria bacterium]MDH3432689.1 sulfur oxidation c-type cytochrome SoxX [Gammaproteobacteria bacterium]
MLSKHDLSSRPRWSALAAGVAIFSLAAASNFANGSPQADIAEGKLLSMERSKGNCLACHMIEDGELPGDLGPPLLAMKVRFPDRKALVEQVCDATVRNSNSRMPPFCRHGILSEEEVELIVDYLYTL